MRRDTIVNIMVGVDEVGAWEVNICELRWGRACVTGRVHGLLLRFYDLHG